MRRILIAEDNAFYRRMLEAMLQGWGYEVQPVTNGQEAWDVLREVDAPPWPFSIGRCRG